MNRTQDEIAARVAEIEAGGQDFFGFRRETLLGFLDFEHAKPYLKPEATKEMWEGDAADDPHAAALEYLEFAFGKALNHRGISAGRSVEKMAEYAWLLDLDETVAAMDAAEYAQYGVPKLVAFATTAGPEFAAIWERVKDEALVHMSQGEPCQPDCEEGCGL